MAENDGILIVEINARLPRELYAGECALGVVTQGELPVTVEGREFTMREGDALLFKSGAPCRIGAGERSRVWAASFWRKDIVPGCLTLMRSCPVLTSFFISEDIKYMRFEGANEALMRDAEHMLRKYCENSAYSQDRLLCALVEILLHMCATCRVHAPAVGMDKARDCGDMLDYIYEHCATATLTDVARAFHFHPNTVSHMLKKATGTGFQQIRNRMRVERAAQFLSSGQKTVREAADMCGYSNMTHFYAQFKDQFGINPGEYAKRGGTNLP